MIDPEVWTGERLETFVYNDTTFEHLHRYAIVLEQSLGKRVLDIACGEGYGSHLIAAFAEEVVGVDISQETINEAVLKYRKSNLTFIQGSAAAIPWEDNYFDLVVSFETIEHHDRHNEMMQEVKRVLKTDGLLIISSPDKRFYSDKPGSYQNPYHIKELYKEEFEQLLRKHFTTVQLFSQSSFIGSMVLADTTGDPSPKWYNGSYEEIASIPFEAPFTIAIAANTYLPPPSNSFFKSAVVLEQRLQNAEQNMHRDFAKQVTDYVTYNVTEQVTREVTERVTQEITIQVEKRMQQTKPYRIGNAVLKPFKYFHRIFNSE